VRGKPPNVLPSTRVGRNSPPRWRPPRFFLCALCVFLGNWRRNLLWQRYMCICLWRLAKRLGVRQPSLRLMRIYRFQLLKRGRTGFSVAAGLSAIALATADVPPAVLSAVALAKAEAGGILPPGLAPGFRPSSQIIQPSRAGVPFSAGRDARLYGRQDARRYQKMRIRCRALWRFSPSNLRTALAHRPAPPVSSMNTACPVFRDRWMFCG